MGDRAGKGVRKPQRFEARVDQFLNELRDVLLQHGECKGDASSVQTKAVTESFDRLDVEGLDLLLIRVPDELERRVRQKLPNRMREVAELAALGLSDKEIATERGVTTATARNYMARVYKLLGIHSRNELMRLMFRADPSLLQEYMGLGGGEDWENPSEEATTRRAMRNEGELC